MNFVVVSNEWLSEHGILPLPTMRKSKDGSKIIMHEDYLAPFIEASNTVEETLEGETIVKPMVVETYAHNSTQLKELLESEEWNHGEEEHPDNTSDYIQVAAVKNLMTATKANIQTFSMTNKEVNKVADMLPEWIELIGTELEAKFKLQYNGKPYRVVQAHTPQADWKPDENKSLYNLISDHDGTLDDPIPYEHWLVLDKGLYYTENEVTYKCTTDSIVGYDADLSELGALVEKIEEKSFNL